MKTYFHSLLIALLFCSISAAQAADGPDCTRPLTLALHDHGLLYSSQTDAGIDKDFADELMRRSGCKIIVTVMPRARIWQLIESGALDFSLSGITDEARDKFAGFAWYFSNKYYLLVRKDAKVQQLADFENNPKLMLGVIRSFRYSENANRLVDNLALEQRVDHATRLEPLYQILALNRVQGMIIEPFDYPQVDAGSIRSLTTIVDLNDASVLHGLIMSRKAISLAEQEKWRMLVNQMRADGTVLHIFEKYFHPDLAKSLVTF
ncbi:MAG: amino acid ABC transporter substrate-binding protein [Glaciimonas sp.]|nr:amino acid ABC transporter substrate-binding protein [Glaciimonas sp.]